MYFQYINYISSDDLNVFIFSTVTSRFGISVVTFKDQHCQNFSHWQIQLRNIVMSL